MNGSHESEVMLLQVIGQLVEIIREQAATINTLLDERPVVTVQKSAV